MSRESQRATDLLKRFEGFSAKPYKDNTQWSIGYGTRHDGDQSVRVTKDEAAELMQPHIAAALDTIAKFVKVPLTSNQTVALVSFIYNIGVPRFKTSTMLRKLNRGDYKGAADAMLQWKYVKGIIDDGLAARRKSERELFKTEEA